MGNPTEEKAVFKAFLTKAPLFAGAPVKDWQLAPKEPPDVECDLSDGRKVDVELTSWVDEDQIAESKGRESLVNPFRELFAEAPNNTENFWLVLLEVKERLRKNDAQALRSEVLQLIAQLDQEHSTKPEWQLKDYFYFRDFENFPVMRLYLESLEIHPRAERGGDKGSIGWITFPMPGGFYSPESMVDALCERIQHKIDKYLVKPRATHDFHLLVHYDKAFAHNTPVIAPGFGFKEAVAAAAKRIGTAVGVFDQIFVYVDIKEGQAFRLYPQAEALLSPEAGATHGEQNRDSGDEDFTITFSPDLSPEQITTALSALADYYRACGGVGFKTDFEPQTVGVREPKYAR